MPIPIDEMIARAQRALAGYSGLGLSETARDRLRSVGRGVWIEFERQGRRLEFRGPDEDGFFSVRMTGNVGGYERHAYRCTEDELLTALRDRRAEGWHVRADLRATRAMREALGQIAPDHPRTERVFMVVDSELRPMTRYFQSEHELAFLYPIVGREESGVRNQELWGAPILKGLVGPMGPEWVTEDGTVCVRYEDARSYDSLSR